MRSFTLKEEEIDPRAPSAKMLLTNVRKAPIPLLEVACYLEAALKNMLAPSWGCLLSHVDCLAAFVFLPRRLLISEARSAVRPD